MKCMEKNKRLFYFAKFVKSEMTVDEYGNETGEYKTTLSKPMECHANVSPASGSVDTQFFGNNVDYDRVIVIESPFPDIDENTVLWVDRMPILSADGSNTGTPHDYIVKRRAESLNSLSLAISKVNVR